MLLQGGRSPARSQARRGPGGDLPRQAATLGGRLVTPQEHAAFVRLLKQCPDGPRIELGVFRGATLGLIAKHPGITIGVDSFAGMAAPGKRDTKDGWTPYPLGRLSAPMRDAQRAAPKARLLKGFVPDILPAITESGFAFAHLDMDQYGPTLAALQWVWGRMAPGGVICCDDWFADRDWLAAGAINDFAAGIGRTPDTAGRKAWWIA
ncbi:TylF/MycF/NovP-related O-methyltransferase [Rhizobium ruizarguesonis]